MERQGRTADGIAAMLVACALLLGGCFGGDVPAGGSSEPVDIYDEAIESPYDWDNLVWDERGRATYVVDGQVRSRTGIDVSEHNESIDWDAVASDGIEFVYIRAAWRGSTEGGLYEDERFEEYLEGARAAGLDVGLYVYSQATNEAEGREEAEFVLDLLDGRSLELPIAFDHETTAEGTGRADGSGREELTAAARAFCDTVEAAGYNALVYGNAHDLARLDTLSFAREGYWFAEYSDAPSVPLELYLWQYTYQGSVAGISTTVDLNIELVNALDE